MKPFLVGITGPPGSGKSEVCKIIAKQNPEITVIKFDNYFLGKKTLPKFGNWYNWDIPKNIDFKKLYENLSELKNSLPTNIPTYSKPKTKRTGTRFIRPTKIIIVEGHMLFYNPSVRNLFDLKLFFDTDEKTQIKRFLKKNPDAENYVKNISMPATRKYIIPTKEFSDFVIDATKGLKVVTKEVSKLILRKFKAR